VRQRPLDRNVGHKQHIRDSGILHLNKLIQSHEVGLVLVEIPIQTALHLQDASYHVEDKSLQLKGTLHRSEDP
jgi:hypothetical protein